MTVVDADTGCSVALVTPADLEAYARYLPVEGPVSITSALLQELPKRHGLGDLVLLVQHVLGDA
jgi:hypothetical protein